MPRQTWPATFGVWAGRGGASTNQHKRGQFESFWVHGRGGGSTREHKKGRFESCWEFVLGGAGASTKEAGFILSSGHGHCGSFFDSPEMADKTTQATGDWRIT